MTGIIDGLGLVPVVMGLFGISEVLTNLEKLDEKRTVIKTRLRTLLPSIGTGRDQQSQLPGGHLSVISWVSFPVEAPLYLHLSRML